MAAAEKKRRLERGPEGARLAQDRAPAEDPRGGPQRARAAPSGSPRSPREIEREGIEYVFFQQVSITGHINGKGVVASWFPQVAERGYQLVYGATADLFTDRQDNYIGFGPEESELAAIADLDTFAALPWDQRVARVYCDCYDTETGELLDADPRQNLKRIAHDVEEELGYSFLCGIEPEMMWLKLARGRRGARGRDQALVLPHQPVRAAAAGDPRRRRLRQGDGARHELRRPRGRPRPARAQLPLRPARVRTADNITTYRQICTAVGRNHGLHASFMPKPFTGVSANGHHHHFTLVDESGQQRLPRSGRAGAALGDRPAVHGRDPRPLRRAGLHRLADRQLLQADVGLRLLGAGLQATTAGRTAPARCGSRAAAGSSSAASTPPATPT